MKTVDANVFRLDNTGVPSSILALGRVLQLTKNIMDIVGDVCYSYSFLIYHRNDFLVLWTGPSCFEGLLVRCVLCVRGE